MRISLTYTLAACVMLIVAGCEMSKLHHYQYASVTPLRDYKFKDKRVVSYDIDVLEFDESLAIRCEGLRECCSITLPRNRYTLLITESYAVSNTTVRVFNNSLGKDCAGVTEFDLHGLVVQDDLTPVLGDQRLPSRTYTLAKGYSSSNEPVELTIRLTPYGYPANEDAIP